MQTAWGVRSKAKILIGRLTAVCGDVLGVVHIYMLISGHDKEAPDIKSKIKQRTISPDILV